MKHHTLIDTLDDLTEFKIRKEKPVLNTHVDPVIEWLPTAMGAALVLQQSKSMNAVAKAASTLLLSLGLQKGTAHLLKMATRHMRPNLSWKQNSFPSGHAATAFMGAAFLHSQLREKDRAWALAGYGLALATAVLRLYQNKHWLSDVVAGAVIGFVSVQISDETVKNHLHFADEGKINETKRKEGDD